MLRGNLASRPFYNERLVSLVLVLVAVGVAALTAFNVSRLNALWTDRAELEGAIQRDEDETARVLGEINSTGRQVDAPTLVRLASETGEANALIERRTFSWTTFFDVIEDVLPFDVRVVAVGHRIEDGDLLLVLNVVARDDPDLNDFIDAMLGTGQFLDILPTEKMRDDDGSVSAVIETWYVPLVNDQDSGEPAAMTRQGGRP